MTTDTGKLTPEQDTAIHTLREELRALNHDELKERWIQIGSKTFDSENVPTEFEFSRHVLARDEFILSVIDHTGWDEEHAEEHADDLLIFGEGGLGWTPTK